MTDIDRRVSSDLGWTVAEANAHYRALQQLQNKTADPKGEVFGETEVIGSLLGRALEQRDLAIRNGRLGPSWMMRIRNLLRHPNNSDVFEQRPVTLPLTKEFTTTNKNDWAVRVYEFTPRELEEFYRFSLPNDSSKIKHLDQGDSVVLSPLTINSEIKKPYENTGFRVILSHQTDSDGFALPELVLELGKGNFMSYLIEDPAQILEFKKIKYYPGNHGTPNFVRLRTLPGAQTIIEMAEMTRDQDILALADKRQAEAAKN